MAISPYSLISDTFFLDSFAERQWIDPHFPGTRLDCDPIEFVQQVHAYHKEGGAGLVDGYAPFCKHIFVPNFVEATLGALPITEENEHLLRTAYERRRPEELAVLTRFFPR